MTAAKNNLFLGLATAVFLLMVLAGVGRGDSIGDIRRAAAAYEQDLIRWEASHFLDKWLHLAAGLIRDDPGPGERLEVIGEFFAIGEELNRSNQEMERALAAAPDAPDAVAVQASVDELEERRRRIAPIVEEAIESTVSQIADELGVIDRFGAVRWPPVDFTFAPNGLILVRSPRDEIVRIDDRILRHDLSLLEQVELEELIESFDDNVAALVIRIGGLATYPAHVTPRTSLHGALNLVAHEWLHHWLYFRPLGKAWFAGGELTSVNETVANIAGEEIGDLALERLTGQVIERRPWQPPQARERVEPDPGVFDFRREMRATRHQLEGLLERGEVGGAERYLEERRRVFVDNGYNIRKLNTAWFAFHGTYADSAASISPIEGQLRALRADSATLAEFLDRVAVIDEEGDLEQLAREAGWTPLPP